MTAWKSRSKIASSLLASPEAIILASKAASKARCWWWGSRRGAPGRAGPGRPGRGWPAAARPWRCGPAGGRRRSPARRWWAGGCRGRRWPGRCWPGRRGRAAGGRSLPRGGSGRPRCGSGRSLHGESGADLVHRQAVAAQLDDPGEGAVFFRGVLAAGFARRSEQGKLPGAQVAGQRIQRGRGVAEPAGGLVQGGTLVQVGAQRFVAPLVGLGRVGEQLPSLALGRFGCHGADLSEVACWPTAARTRQECPGWWWIVLVHSHPEHDRSA